MREGHLVVIEIYLALCAWKRGLAPPPPPQAELVLTPPCIFFGTHKTQALIMCHLLINYKASNKIKILGLLYFISDFFKLEKEKTINKYWWNSIKCTLQGNH